MGSETSKKLQLINDDDVPKRKLSSLLRRNLHGWLLIILLEI